MRHALALLILLVGLRAAGAQDLRASLNHCSSIPDAERRLICFDEVVGSLPPLAQQPTEQQPSPAARARDGVAPRWHVATGRDAMTDQPRVTLTVASEPGSDPATLALRCFRNRTEVLVLTDQYLGVVDRLNVLIRFGARPAQRQSWGQSSDGKAAFAPAAIPLIRDMQQADTTLMEVATRVGPTLRMRFVTAGLSDVLPQLQRACGW
jgi:type VI secretion system VasI family protein